MAEDSQVWKMDYECIGVLSQFNPGAIELKGQIFTLKEVEETTKLSRSTLYRRLRKGSLQGYQLDNGMWRVPWEEVQRILGNLKTPGNSE